MKKKSKYVSKELDEDGLIEWTDVESDTWRTLVNTQMKELKGKACDEYMLGIEKLGICADHIPQLPDLSASLRAETGWEVAPVPCLIPFGRFFELLASKRFPCATFIRTPEELHYLQEPDIFHEVFGHCPMLTNPFFANFTECYGKLGLEATPKERVILARLYWFTAEFGMIRQENDWRYYGGGIMSSPSEAAHCISDKAERKPLQMLEAMRTPYRIDIVQPIYYYIESFKELGDFSEGEIMDNVRRTQELGLFEPVYEQD